MRRLQAVGFVLLSCFLAGCSTKPLGRLDGRTYYPLLGDFSCEIPGTASTTVIRDKYSDHGAVVSFYWEGFGYTVDVQRLGEVVSSATMSERLLMYFEKSQGPHMQERYKGSEILFSKPVVDSGRTVLFSVLRHPPRRNLWTAFELSEESFTGAVTVLSTEYAYTVSTDVWKPGEYATTMEDHVYGLTLGDFSQCRFPK